MKIALIAGSGNFPIQIAKQNQDAFVLCIDQHSYPSFFENKSATVLLTEPDSWISILKQNNITHLVMAGKINRISTNEKISNTLYHQLIQNTLSLGDNSALNFIQKFFTDNGFKMLPVSSILNDCFFTKGFYKKEFFSLNHKEFVIENAKFGVEFLNTMSKFDIGQSVVINNKLVYAVEALEGTDSMITRAGDLYKKLFNSNDFGPVLIKIPKLNQNCNMDLPVIGLKTIKKCKELGFSSIVLSSSGTLIIDLKKVQTYLNKNKFCIYAI